MISKFDKLLQEMGVQMKHSSGNVNNLKQNNGINVQGNNLNNEEEEFEINDTDKEFLKTLGTSLNDDDTPDADEKLFNIIDKSSKVKNSNAANLFAKLATRLSKTGQQQNVGNTQQ